MTITVTKAELKRLVKTITKPVDDQRTHLAMLLIGLARALEKLQPDHPRAARARAYLREIRDTL